METQELEVMSPNESASQIEAVSRAEIDIQIRTARAYPRKELSVIKQRMLSAATLDEETAASCFYKIPRGGTMIEGPSVRLAEVTAANYGNLRVATRTLETVTNGDNPHVVVQVAIHDLENNLAVQVEKRRRITGKRAKGGKPDEDDINLATNACASIAFRDAVFRVVPNVLVHPVFEACKKVAAGKATSLAQNRVNFLKRLAQMGAPEARVLASLSLRKVEDITLEHLEDLVGRGTALKEGGTVEDIFPVDAAKPTATAQSSPTPAAPPTATASTSVSVPKTATAPATGQGTAGTKADADDVPMNFPPASSQPVPVQTLKQEMPGVAAPAPAPAPAATAQGHFSAKPGSLQAELENAITESGFTFANFIAWGEETGNVPDGSSMTMFAEIHDTVARRLLRSKAGLLAGLNRMFPKAS